MQGRPHRQNKIVCCNCNGLKADGTFDVDGGFLVLTSPFGVTRVTLGVQQPRKLATRLLKNICTKVSETAEAAAGVGALPL